MAKASSVVNLTHWVYFEISPQLSKHELCRCWKFFSYFNEMGIIDYHGTSGISRFSLSIQNPVYHHTLRPARNPDCAPFHRRTHLQIYRKPQSIMFPFRYDWREFFKFFSIEGVSRAVKVYCARCIFEEMFSKCLSFFRKMSVQGLNLLYVNLIFAFVKHVSILLCCVDFE